MVEVTFLGTGGAFSAGRRSNLALLIEGSGFRTLVEAGPAIMEELAHANIPCAEIEQVFRGTPLILPDRTGSGEPRLNAVGLNANGRHVFVVFTLRRREEGLFLRPIFRPLHARERG